jgi:hypothetical protein
MTDWKVGPTEEVGSTEKMTDWKVGPTEEVVPQRR